MRVRARIRVRVTFYTWKDHFLCAARRRRRRRRKREREKSRSSVTLKPPAGLGRAILQVIDLEGREGGEFEMRSWMMMDEEKEKGERKICVCVCTWEVHTPHKTTPQNAPQHATEISNPSIRCKLNLPSNISLCISFAASSAHSVVLRERERARK
jgi:hypothetical protein